MSNWLQNELWELDRLLADWEPVGFGICIPIGYMRPALAKMSGLKRLFGGK